MQKKFRIVYWIVRDLASKYTGSLFLGFILGFIISFLGLRYAPTILKTLSSNTDYIGVVGNYNTNNLPIEIQNKISFGLTKLAPDGNPKPGLASWWEATDSGKTYIFHIRKDFKWHDGQNVKTDDIIYNIKDTQSIIVSDEIIKFAIDSPYSPFPVLVSKPIFKKGFVGIGEYKVVNLKIKYNRLESISLIPVERRSKQSKIVYKFYPTENQALTAFSLGEVDAVVDLASKPEGKIINKYSIYENIKTDRIISLFFNNKDKLLSEKTVRQALGYALPDLNEKKAQSPIPYTSWAYSDKTKLYLNDIKQSQKLLKPLSISSESSSLNLITFPQYLKLAEKISESWAKIGFDTKVRVENFVPEDYQILLSAIDLPPDPDQYTLWHSTQSNTNITRYLNVKIDQLLEDGRQEINPDIRKNLYADFARRLTDDSPVLFLYYPKEYTVYRGAYKDSYDY